MKGNQKPPSNLVKHEVQPSVKLMLQFPTPILRVRREAILISTSTDETSL